MSALLLLHGFPLDHRMWSGVQSLLPGAPRVVVPDLPGDALVQGEPTLEAAADMAAEQLRAAGIDRVVVGGLSMGGYVALALLERHPDLVTGLALIDTKSTADTPEAQANRLRIADEVERTGSVDPVRPMSGVLLGQTTRTVRPDVTALVDRWIGEQSPAAVTWCQRAMAARPDRTEVLRAFDGPVRVVVGDEDTVTPVAAADHMVEAARHARLVVIPHAGHLTAIEDPAGVASALAGLLA
ncbi:alpha/beta fold hydrolase [Cellulomonas sp. URHE0023]|uniref:alpha/beta fold hydrolase n=1 Tax=Cellulomonas sp. URHE0023 TaxID=1380354 RepID=UPI0004814EC2|nr:alpha/beta hydrolase [Cellulomonas sp. URHE0023]